MNRIYKNDVIVDQTLIKEELDKKSTIFNYRKENNLFVFETMKNKTMLFDNKTIKLEDSSHQIRIYDPLENYIVQCGKCHCYGHTVVECNQKHYLCSWCGQANCNRKCNQNQKKCQNCKKNHSSLYKGCLVYKDELWKASKTREDKQKNEKFKTLSKNTVSLRANVEHLQTSYANAVKNQEELIENNFEKTNNNYNALCSKVDTLTNQASNLAQNMETIKNNLQLIVTTTKATQQKIEQIEEDLIEMKKDHVDKTSLIVIMFEVIYALATHKMTSKMDIMMNLIAIFQRNSGPNIDKGKIIERIQELEHSSLLLTPTEDESFNKEKSNIKNKKE